MSWATYIKNDLAARICSGHELPDKLTLHSLSEQYEVSLTPVRQAVSELVEGGILQKGPNGRLAINSKKVGSGGPSRPEPPKNHYEQIIGDLIALSMEGQPIRLREEEIAGRYGISQTAARQILGRLAGQGLVEHKPRRGWRLRPFRQAELDAFIEVRELLELKAMSLAWPRLVDADLEAMLAGNVVPADASRPPLIDNSLHRYLVDKANNPYINDFFDRHGGYFERLFEWEALDRQAAVKAIGQHRAILEALLARDRTAARKALNTHLRHGHPALKTGD